MEPVFSPKTLIVFDGVDEEQVERVHADLDKLREMYDARIGVRIKRRELYTVKITSPQLAVKITSPQLAVTSGFSKASRSASNLPWSINSLPEEYRAHFLDQRSAMLEAGEAAHVIYYKLLWYWFLATVWTPIVSRLQSLIPPNRISS